MLQVWFEFASTYSYLTVSRVEAEARRAGVPITWKPFLLGPIFQAKGWQTSPFNLDQAKGAYMWRDMQRRAERFGLPFQPPEVFPAHSLAAARVMTAVLSEAWAGGWAGEVFAAQFARGEDIADPAVLRAALATQTDDPDHWLAQSQTDEVKAALRSTTEEAIAHGIFGAPSFIVEEELFWGDDRLEDALAWALEAR